jgi:hypothetical protein
MEVPKEPLAVRNLKWNDGDDERDVLVRLWKPVPFEDHYVCDFAVDGLPEPVRRHGSGEDSLQALIVALAAIRGSLDPYRDHISFFGMAGFHGIPMGVPSVTGDPQEERRLEALVVSEAVRAIEELMAPKKERMDTYRTRYDPTVHDDLTQLSTQEITKRLRAAAVTEREYREAGNDDVAFVFEMKRLDLIRALRERPEYVETFEALTADADPAISLVAAQMLAQSALAIATFERLRDGGIEPEASEASRTLLDMRKVDERPKPWDAPAFV